SYMRGAVEKARRLRGMLCARIEAGESLADNGPHGGFRAAKRVTLRAIEFHVLEARTNPAWQEELPSWSGQGAGYAILEHFRLSGPAPPSSRAGTPSIELWAVNAASAAVERARDGSASSAHQSIHAPYGWHVASFRDCPVGQQVSRSWTSSRASVHSKPIRISGRSRSARSPAALIAASTSRRSSALRYCRSIEWNTARQ